jgi:hypothetical protein
VLDILKNNMHQNVSDIKDNIFNVALFFMGLFSLRQGAKAIVIMKYIAKKII